MSKRIGSEKRGMSQGINVIPNGDKRLCRTNSSGHKDQSSGKRSNSKALLEIAEMIEECKPRFQNRPLGPLSS